MNASQTRRHIRQQRRKLSRSALRHHETQLIKQLHRSSLLKRYKRFAIYLDTDGEMPTHQLIQTLRKYSKQLFLPVLYPFGVNRLWFIPFHENSRMKKNRFGIIEPADIKSRVSWQNIDVIFMPLVAFDKHGNRLGMGGGFYDRTLSACKKKGHMTNTRFIGLAHELQKVNSLTKNAWDISMHAVVTEKQIYKAI